MGWSSVTYQSSSTRSMLKAWASSGSSASSGSMALPQQLKEPSPIACTTLPQMGHT